jgi:biotin transport system substrate-specific component
MKARDLGYIAVSTAILSVSAWVAIPIGGVPFTLQTLVLCLTAGLLGWKRGVLSVLAYLLLGFIGVPVFAGFTGGAGVLLSPTGGYLIGFLPLALLSGFLVDTEKKGTKGGVLLGLFMGLGVLLCYAFGTIWFIVLSAQESVNVGLWSALTLCVLPYIPLDAVKIILAVFLTKKLRKFIKIR